MSNHFPTVPSSWNIQGLVYKICVDYYRDNYIPISSSALDWSPDVSSWITMYSTPASVPHTYSSTSEVFEVAFGFVVPGTIGSFDQDTAETQVKEMATNYCVALNDFAGDTLSNVTDDITIIRTWVWLNDDYRLEMTDTLSYP